MKSRLTISDLQTLKATGKIRDFQVQNKPKQDNTTPAGRIVAKHFKKKSPQKDQIARDLLQLSQECQLQLQEEYHFARPKLFRFDWCFPDRKIAVEYEGIFSKKSRHTTISGFSKDTEKYNLAASLGYTVLRYTALTCTQVYRDLKILLETN